MSLEVPSDQPIATNTSPPLTVEIPSSTSSTEDRSSSLDSSQTSWPTGIQGSSTSTPTSASCSSLPIHHLTIKFAPLPELAPRKRRSTAPLGMAARTQLTRRRRAGAPHAHSRSPTTMTTTAAGESVVAHPMWTEEEMEEHKRRQVEQHRLRVMKEEGGEGVDDPLLVLGRLVKGAGKQLWRKVSHRDRDRQGREREKEKDGKERDGREKEKTKAEDAVRLALTTISSNGEGKTEDTPTKEKEDEDGRTVWEDANDFLNVGQTETFLEGRNAPYSS
ncbi:hypothetical protein K443DRAFT_674703 [Laccaria amethystina LaAM-08-1]|uniref:Uncharacterized protein n=1 Tax=Laccaria amethystina LaAM-08-1 TaxID=1095629 RepID=A0A0C9XWZ5_9AGAR|nr:hypothetical protein K443DRAFT_674703 [Laccaria amethystina LaAM-08-1]